MCLPIFCDNVFAHFLSRSIPHSVTESNFADPCTPLPNGFDSGLTEGGTTFSVNVTDASSRRSYPSVIRVHRFNGLFFQPSTSSASSRVTVDLLVWSGTQCCIVYCGSSLMNAAVPSMPLRAATAASPLSSPPPRLLALANRPYGLLYFQSNRSRANCSLCRSRTLLRILVVSAPSPLQAQPPARPPSLRHRRLVRLARRARARAQVRARQTLMLPLHSTLATLSVSSVLSQVSLLSSSRVWSRRALLCRLSL